jgi:arsenite-transporting ATPase
LTEQECSEGLTAAGFDSVTIEPTRIFDAAALEGLAAEVPGDIDVAAAITGLDGVIRSAAIRAIKPSPAAVIRVYEPALCCNTGVCGPDVDQALVEFTADLAHLVERGADIARHNLANDPMAFANDEAVRAFLHTAGSAGLPLVTVNGVTVVTGRYPSRAELERFAGLAAEFTELTMLSDDGGSCCGGGGCC